MNNFLTGLPLFCLVLTIGAFSFGQWCQKKTKSPLCNPILIGALLVIGVLLLTGMDPEAACLLMPANPYTGRESRCSRAKAVHRHTYATLRD